MPTKPKPPQNKNLSFRENPPCIEDAHQQKSPIIEDDKKHIIDDIETQHQMPYVGQSMFLHQVHRCP